MLHVTDESSTERWTLFFRRCLDTRVSEPTFEKLATTLIIKSPCSGHDIAKILFSSAHNLDPLLLEYTESLVKKRLVFGHDILGALFEYSRRRETEAKEQVIAVDQQTPPSLPGLEETMINYLARHYSAPDHVLSLGQARNLLKVLSTWMTYMIVSSNEAISLDVSSAIYSITPEVLLLRQGFGILLLTISEKPSFMRALQSTPDLDFVKEFASSLVAFINLLAESSVQVANRLDFLVKSNQVLRIASSNNNSGERADRLEMAALQVNSILDGPSVYTRAGLYVFLDGLFGVPTLVNDTILLSHLSARYKDDVQTPMVDLIIAMFDLIAVGANRGETTDRLLPARTFLVNKVPVLMLSMFVSISYEFSISQALSRLDPAQFPSFSQGFNIGKSGILADTRQDFLYSCALHGLITEESIERILGESPMQTTSTSGKYIKANLVAEYASNVQKLEQLIGDIETMSGNAVAVVEAVTTIFHGYCSARDTMSLKVLCHQLSRRPLSLDVVLVFVSPSSFLQPLCQVLDDWKYEDDQGEYQPVYDEFSACVLLVLAITHRYRLKPADLGLTPGQGFVAQLLESGSGAQLIATLSAEQNKKLGGWIKGLFETEGISDDLMSTCPPQDFYMMVATIFSQSIIACKSNALNLEVLKSGLELLLEPFLMPCLVLALQWLIDHIMELHDDADVLMPVLHKLIRPSSIHGEALAMHTTILSFIGKSLTSALQDMRQRQMGRHDIDPIIEKLQPHQNYFLGIEVWHDDFLHGSTNIGGMFGGLGSSLASLCFWSSPTGITSTLPNFTHWQLSSSVQLHGASKVLQAIVEEVKTQTITGFGDMALDIATAMICSSDTRMAAANLPTGNANAPMTTKPRLSLREMLQLEVEDAAKTMVANPTKAEVLVRLGRAVERQLSSIPVADIQQLSLPDMITTMELDQAPELAAGGLAIGPTQDAMDFTQAEEQALQLDIDAALGSQTASKAFQDVIQSADDDIFGGLALDDMDM